MTEAEKKIADEKALAEKKALESKVPDYSADLKAKDDEIIRIRKERDDYKAMGLKYKAKAKEEGKDADDEDMEDKMRRVAREEYLATQESRLSKEKDEYISKMSTELREAKLALANKPNGTSTSAGGNSAAEDNKPKDNFFSENQLAEIRKQVQMMQKQGIKISEEAFIKDLKEKAGRNIVYPTS